MSPKKIVLRGRLKGNQLRKLSRLLDMLYKPSELAEEIGFTRRQIYRAYIPLGCPHERDETGHLWINGEAFHQWYRETYKKAEIAEDEVYCLACKQIVSIHNPIKKRKGRYHYLLITCPECGKKVSKAIGKLNALLGEKEHDNQTLKREKND